MLRRAVVSGTGGNQLHFVPTGETAMSDAGSAFLKGWYWNDDLDKEEEESAFLLPELL